MKFLARIGLALAIAAGVTSAVGYWYLSDRLTASPLPASVLAVEEALAMPESIGLFHVDVAHAVASERTLLGEEDRAAMLEPFSLGDGIFAELRRQGFDPRDNLDQVLGSLILTAEGPTSAMVLLGRFPVSEIKAILTKSYAAELHREGNREVLLASHQDPETCERAGPIAVHVAEDRITVAGPQIIGRVLDRLGNPGATRALAAWRNYRSGKLFSGALFVPPQAALEQLDLPIVTMISGMAEDRAATVQSLYVGGAVEAVPPSITLDARIENSDPEWARKEAAVFETWRQSLDEDYAKRLPSLARLLQNLSVAETDQALLLRAALDQDSRSEFRTDSCRHHCRTVFRIWGRACSGGANCRRSRKNLAAGECRAVCGAGISRRFDGLRR